MINEWEEIKNTIVNETDIKNESHAEEKISSLQDVWENANEKDKNVLSDIIKEREK